MWKVRFFFLLFWFYFPKRDLVLSLFYFATIIFHTSDFWKAFEREAVLVQLSSSFLFIYRITEKFWTLSDSDRDSVSPVRFHVSISPRFLFFKILSLFQCFSSYQRTRKSKTDIILWEFYRLPRWAKNLKNIDRLKTTKDWNTVLVHQHSIGWGHRTWLQKDNWDTEVFFFLGYWDSADYARRGGRLWFAGGRGGFEQHATWAPVFPCVLLVVTVSSLSQESGMGPGGHGQVLTQPLLIICLIICTGRSADFFLFSSCLRKSSLLLFVPPS